MSRKIAEKAYETIFFVCALMAVLIVAMIFIFVFIKGWPVMQKTGVIRFLTGTNWGPLKGSFEILPMIVGSMAVTVGALILGVPFGLATAIFLAEFAPKRATTFIRPAIELLAGIPSVVYGLFGMVLVVKAIQYITRTYLPGIDPSLQTGYSVLAASIILAIMILPTVINITEDSLRAVHKEYKEGSLALGATHWQTVFRVMIPAARSGILAAVVLGMGRAIGETMAVIMVAGNTTIIPKSVLSATRTMTGNIAIEMPYSAGDHTQALFATGIVLFVFITILNLFATAVSRKGAKA